jgi:hypothetical protein
VDEVNVQAAATAADAERHRQAMRAYEDRLASLRKRLQEAPPQERSRIEPFLKRLIKKGPPPFKLELAVFGPSSRPRQTHVHLHGDSKSPGPLVAPGVPAVLPGLVPRKHDGSPPDLLDLARWLVSPSNPLAARVEANRIWQHLFGAGIVATPDDFGTQGEPPSHPELLDHLATRLMRSAWSRKA